MTQEKKAATRVRVYTYTGQDGTVYYSFTRQAKVRTPGQILTLDSRLGVHLENFIPLLRREGRKFVQQQQDDED